MIRRLQMFAGAADQVPAARAYVRQVLTTADVPADLVDDAALAVTELATNAIRHTPGDGPFTVGVTVAGGRVMVQVESDRAGGIPQPLTVPADAESGRGLAMLARLGRLAVAPAGRSVIWSAPIPAPCGHFDRAAGLCGDRRTHPYPCGPRCDRHAHLTAPVPTGREDHDR